MAAQSRALFFQSPADEAVKNAFNLVANEAAFQWPRACRSQH